MNSQANVRGLVGFEGPYHQICREERNVAALLYAALLSKANLARFLDAIGSRLAPNPAEAAVYYEYAFLRDLWNESRDEVVRRQLILDRLDTPNRAHLQQCSNEDFNRHFGAVPKPSAKYIQSPGTWSVSRFAETIRDRERFESACRFKWAFNIKPDIVIHTDRNSVVCIEAKLDSGEGRYPTSRAEVDLFKDRDLRPVRQLELQRYLMEELLGLNAEFVFLVKSRSGEPPADTTVLTWAEAFSEVKFPGDTLGFVGEWTDRLKTES